MGGCTHTYGVHSGSIVHSLAPLLATLQIKAALFWHLRVEKRLADVERHGDGTGDAAGHRARHEVHVGVVAALRVQLFLAQGVRRHHCGLDGMDQKLCFILDSYKFPSVLAK